MTPAQQLECEAAALRAAAAHEDFGAAALSTARYCRALEAALRGLPPPEAAARVAEAQHLLEWARRHLCAARARLGLRLRAAERAAQYEAGTRAPACTWRLEA